MSWTRRKRGASIGASLHRAFTLGVIPFAVAAVLLTTFTNLLNGPRSKSSR